MTKVTNIAGNAISIDELKELLIEIAEGDLIEGSLLRNHPCMIAVRALDECFEDINTLRSALNSISSGRSKAVVMLTKLNYDPSW